MKLKQIILMILSMILLLLSGCTGGSSGANENIVASKAGADLNSISSNQLQGVVPAPRFYAQPHSATQYYTSVSNTTQYQAFSLGGPGVKAHITSISLENNSLFEIESDQALYGVNQCQVGMTVTSNPCEILIHAINPFIQMQTPVVLSIIVNGILYKKTVSKSGSYAYIAGDFTQSYQSGNTLAVKQSSLPAGSNCGPKGNAPCQILLYDFQTESLSSFATTDSTVNDMAIDSDGNLYIGGMFNTIVHQGQSLSSNMQQPSNLLVKMLNTGDGYIAQDWLRELSGGGVVNYPNDAINAITFDPKNYQLYVAGSFNSMANYTSSSSQSFPILQLSLNSETNFKNALGLDINNPNAAISAVGVDESSNLYLSGFYGIINQFKFNNQQSAFSINKCPNLGNEHSCLTGSSYSISINGFKSGYKNQPAYNLTFQPNGALYAAGGFTNMFYEDSSLTHILGDLNGEYLVAYNSDPFNTFVYGPPNSWSSLSSSYLYPPDNVIGTIEPYANSQYFIGGQFSRIGTIDSDSNSGECGVNNNGSCLFAQFNGNTWNKIFATDGIINAVVIVSGIVVGE